MGAIQVARGALPLIALAVGACAGPRPAIEHVDSRAGPTYEVRVTVVNRSGGRGQAEVTARLIDSSTRETAAEANRNIDLDPHERVDVPLSLEPTRPGTYQTVVEVHYPIE